MSIIIADSGATKTEWCVWEDGESNVIATEGLNPYYHTIDSIRDVIKEDLLPKIDVENVEEVFFYGAGCDSDEKKEVVKEALETYFGKSKIEVYHDLLGAARACFLDKPGIACILGTGSNSCLYDGQKIVEHIPSLAFILGDEGSAGYFGKKIINSYFRFELPPELKKSLEENYNMSLEHITEGVYDGAQKSRFIASYGSFLGKHSDHPFIQKMLREGFESFITRILMNYTNAKDYEVRFIGSVGHAYKEMISEILRSHGMTPGGFIQKPMQRMVEYHTKRVHD
ncbi:hypothetical protein NC796_01345 [Aliifodinibius sp. S!AR15-10]|uniref:hypothetical protein n=1 Tax=Aliifodinibius sp. S!AR15-10 TaxID=2950437 RepID=UPI002860A4E4|nr:hypothetical protein [Aliifodinibius sp. S!AR15-10]MDR8389761.1 hypothetical protein [Aliifodinibius sp. S!AR15-10]